jgi:hypothetical protein
VQFVDSCLVDPQAKQLWRDLMAAINYFFRHPVAERVREEGREDGRVQQSAQMTLHILEWRGIHAPDAVRERVEACSDLDQLETWAQRAVHAAKAEDLFADELP